MPYRSRVGAGYVIPAGALDDHPGLEPVQMIHWRSRAPWFVHTPTLKLNEEGP